MITKQDIIDSFIPWRPLRYLKARLKIIPFVLIGVFIVIIIIYALETINDVPRSKLRGIWC